MMSNGDEDLHHVRLGDASDVWPDGESDNALWQVTAAPAGSSLCTEDALQHRSFPARLGQAMETRSMSNKHLFKNASSEVLPNPQKKSQENLLLVEFERSKNRDLEFVCKACSYTGETEPLKVPLSTATVFGGLDSVQAQGLPTSLNMAPAVISDEVVEYRDKMDLEGKLENLTHVDTHTAELRSFYPAETSLSCSKLFDVSGAMDKSYLAQDSQSEFSHVQRKDICAREVQKLEQTIQMESDIIILRHMTYKICEQRAKSILHNKRKKILELVFLLHGENMVDFNTTLCRPPSFTLQLCRANCIFGPQFLQHTTRALQIEDVSSSVVPAGAIYTSTLPTEAVSSSAQPTVTVSSCAIPTVAVSLCTVSATAVSYAIPAGSISCTLPTGTFTSKKQVMTMLHGLTEGVISESTLEVGDLSGFPKEVVAALASNLTTEAGSVSSSAPVREETAASALVQAVENSVVSVSVPPIESMALLESAVEAEALSASVSALDVGTMSPSVPTVDVEAMSDSALVENAEAALVPANVVKDVAVAVPGTATMLGARLISVPTPLFGEVAMSMSFPTFRGAPVSMSTPFLGAAAVLASVPVLEAAAVSASAPAMETGPLSQSVHVMGAGAMSSSAVSVEADAVLESLPAVEAGVFSASAPALVDKAVSASATATEVGAMSAPSPIIEHGDVSTPAPANDAQDVSAPMPAVEAGVVFVPAPALEAQYVSVPATEAKAQDVSTTEPTKKMAVVVPAEGDPTSASAEDLWRRPFLVLAENVWGVSASAPAFDVGQMPANECAGDVLALGTGARDVLGLSVGVGKVLMPDEGEVQAPDKGLGEVPAPEEAVLEVPTPEEAVVEVPVLEEAAVEVPAPEEAAVEVPEPEEAAVEVPVPEEAAVEVPVPEEAAVEVPVPREAAIGVPLPGEAAMQVLEPRKAAMDVLAPGEAAMVELPVPEEAAVEVPAPVGLPAPEEAAVELTAPEEAAVEVPAPEEAAVEVAAPEEAAVEVPAQEEAAVEVQAPEEDAVEVLAPEEAAVEVPVPEGVAVEVLVPVEAPVLEEAAVEVPAPEEVGMELPAPEEAAIEVPEPEEAAVEDQVPEEAVLEVQVPQEDVLEVQVPEEALLEVPSPEEAAMEVPAPVEVPTSGEAAMEVPPPEEAALEIPPPEEAALEVPPPEEAAVEVPPPEEAAVEVPPPEEAAVEVVPPEEAAVEVVPPEEAAVEVVPPEEAAVNVLSPDEAAMEVPALEETALEEAVVEVPAPEEVAMEVPAPEEAAVHVDVAEEASAPVEGAEEVSSHTPCTRSCSVEKVALRSCASADRSAPVLSSVAEGYAPIPCSVAVGSVAVPFCIGERLLHMPCSVGDVAALSTCAPEEGAVLECAVLPGGLLVQELHKPEHLSALSHATKEQGASGMQHVPFDTNSSDSLVALQALGAVPINVPNDVIQIPAITHLTDSQLSTDSETLSLSSVPNMEEEDEIVKRAKQEAEVQMRVAQLKQKGLWSLKKLTRYPEPSRPKSHQDYLLEEMQWLAGDFAQERRWKRALAKKLARMVVRFHDEQKQKEERAKKDELSKLRRIASGIAKEVKHFWNNIEKVLQFKQQSLADEKRKKDLDKHLNYIVGQTEKYSDWLSQSLNASRPASSYGGSVGCSPAPSEREDQDFEPEDEDDDEETIALEEEVASVDVGEHKREIELLQHEGKLPLEELLRSLPPEILQSVCHTDRNNSDKLAANDEGSRSPNDRCEQDCSTAVLIESEDVKEYEVDDDEDDDDDDDDVDVEQHEEGPLLKDTHTIDVTCSGADDDAEYDAGEEDDEDMEQTIDEQEAVEGMVNHQEELEDLAREGELCLEELLEKYKGASMDSPVETSEECGEENDSIITEEEEEEENEDQDEQKEVDLLSISENGPDKGEEDSKGAVVLGMESSQDATKEIVQVSSTDSGGPKKEITDIAAAAESLQPTGYTLATAQVKTPVPFLLRGELREYQHIGIDWLVTMHDKMLNGILADEMGLGKTIQTIALLAHLACDRGVWGPHLIVVPTSVMLNWEMEFKRWSPAFKILTYYGVPKERKQKRQGWTRPNAFHVCITSYKLVLQDHQAFRRKKWRYLILDEAQNIKNFKSQRWQSLLNFNSEHRLLLTGTPLQNSLMELWSLMHFLMPHVFQSHREFREWFSNPLTGMIEGSQEYNDSLVKRLHKVLRPFLLRRVKMDVEKQMPKKYEHVVRCRLSKRQRFLYDDFMSQASTKETLESGHFMSVINILMQLRKVCNHPNLFDPRPISSPFITQGICYSTASLVLSACELDPWKSVDLSIFDLINLEGRLSRYEAEVFLPNRKVNQKLIEEISSSPDPPPRPKPVKMKVNRMVQPVQKPDGRTVVVVSSSKVACTDYLKQGSEQSSIPAQTFPQRAPTIQKLGVSSPVTSAAAVKQPSDIKVLHVIPGVTSAPNPSPQAPVITGKQESPGSGLHNVPPSKVPEATVSSVPQLQHAPCVLSVGSKDGSAQAGHKQVQRINKGVTMDTTVTSCPVVTIMQSTAVAQPKAQILPLPVAPAATTTTGALNRVPRVFAALPVQQVAPSLVPAGRSTLQTTVATPIVPSAPLRMVQSNPITTVGSPRPQLLQGCTAPGGTVQQRVVLTPQTQARLPTGEVISIAQLAALMNQSPPGQPLTLHIQGNKLALACSPIRMLNPTPQQHLQMQGGIVHVIKPSGQGQVAAVTPLQTVSSAAKMIQVSRPIAAPFQNRPRTPTLLVAHTASLSPAVRPNIPSTNIIRAVSQTATVGCLPVGLQAVRPRQLSVPTAHLVFSSTSQLALASSSQAAVASASQAAVAFVPQVAVAATPQVAVAAVASTPQVVVASVSQAAVASATLASTPQAAVASAPQAAVASAPQAAVASVPQAAVASAPQAAVASVSQEAVHLPVSTKPSQPIHSASATKSSNYQTIKQIPEIQSVRQALGTGSHFSTTSVAKPAPTRTTIRVPSIPIPTPLERPQTRRITAAQQKLEKPEASPLQLSWLEKLRVQRHTERLDRLYTVTARRCAASPIYGVEVLRMCDLRGDYGYTDTSPVHGGSWSWVGAVHCLHCKPGAQPEHQTCFGRQTAAISAMIALPEKRLAQLQNIIDRFIFVVPPVEAPPISLHTSHPPPWMVHGERVLRRTLHDELSPRSAYLHRIRCNMRTQFPDLRLIQYDCGKLQTLDILLRRFKAGTHRVLIFTQMTRMLDILEQFLNFHGYIYLRLDGTTRVEQRQALMDLFNADPRIFCFILSTRSGGVGVNLTGADTVVFYDSDWNPTMDAQAQDRCHRIGQTRDVHIYRLIGERTVEENILKKANQKRMLGDVAIEGGNFTTAYFKQQTIRELFENPEEISRQEAAGVAAAAQPSHGDDDGNPSRDNIFEQALGRAEDEEDTKAANLAKAEQVAELAEFSEVATEEGDDGEVREDEEPSKAEEEINALVEQLTPIERYALKFLENSLAPDADESQKARDTSNAAKKESHAARPSAFTESGNLGCADDITQSREETEEFILRERHMQKTTDQLQSVIHSPKLDTSGIDVDPAAPTKVIDTSPLKYHDCSRKPSDVIEHSQKFETSTDNVQEEQVPSADYQEQMFETSSMTSLLPQQSENVKPIEENVEPIEENVEPIEENVEPIEENVSPSRHSPVEQDPGVHMLRIAKINPIPLPISESPQSVEPKDYHEEPAAIGEKSDDAVVGKDETPSCLEDESTTIPSQLLSDTLTSNSKIQDHIDSSVESLNITSSVAALDESMEFRNKLLQNECDTSVNEHPASSPAKNKLTDTETTTEEPPLKKPRIYISEDVKEHEEPAAPAADSSKNISDDVKKENGNRRGKLQILARGHQIGRRLPSGSSPVRTRSSKRVLALERLLNMPCHSRRGTFVTGRRRKAKRVERVVERSKKSKGTLSMQHHGKDTVVNQGTQHDSEKAHRELRTDSIMRRQGQIMRSLRRKNIYKQKLEGEPPVKLGRQEAQSSGASKAEAASSTSSERPSSPVITRASLRLSVLCQSPTRTVPPPLKRQERARRVLSFGQKSEGSSTPGRACDASGLSPTKRVTRQAIRRSSARPSNDWD